MVTPAARLRSAGARAPSSTARDRVSQARPTAATARARRCAATVRPPGSGRAYDVEGDDRPLPGQVGPGAVVPKTVSALVGKPMAISLSASTSPSPSSRSWASEAIGRVVADHDQGPDVVGGLRSMSSAVSGPAAYSAWSSAARGPSRRPRPRPPRSAGCGGGGDQGVVGLDPLAAPASAGGGGVGTTRVGELRARSRSARPARPWRGASTTSRRGLASTPGPQTLHARSLSAASLPVMPTGPLMIIGGAEDKLRRRTSSRSSSRPAAARTPGSR